MAADIAGDLTTTCGVANMNRVGQVECFDELCKIVSVRVHVVAVPRLARPAVAATIMGDTAIAVRRQEEHLIFPSVCAQRPAMTEDDWLSLTPILVVEFKVTRILFANCNRGH